MNLTIKRMSPELAADYFDFFDHRAFSDNSPFYPCYCNAFNMTNEALQADFARAQANGGGVEDYRLVLRESAAEMIARNSIQGYLAYDDGVSIGWCNANDKRSYTHFGEFDLDAMDEALDFRDLIADDGSQKIKSIVCFEIAPEYRGKGIATALLKRVCEDAAIDGYDAVEVYPVLREARDPLDFTGPVHLYEKAGFVRTAQHGRILVMQKVLK